MRSVNLRQTRFAAAAGSPFWPKRGEHPHTHGLLLCDVNNDGKLDFVTYRAQSAADGSYRMEGVPRGAASHMQVRARGFAPATVPSSAGKTSASSAAG